MRFFDYFIREKFPVIDFNPNRPSSDWQITFYSNSALTEFILTNLWWIIILVVLILSIVIWLSLRNQKTHKSVSMAQEVIDKIIQDLGGISNINAASIEGARLSFKVKSTKSTDLNAIKATGALGIFVSGQTIKMIFPYDAQALIETVNQMLKGE